MAHSTWWHACNVWAAGIGSPCMPCRRSYMPFSCWFHAPNSAPRPQSGSWFWDRKYRPIYRWHGCLRSLRWHVCCLFFSIRVVCCNRAPHHARSVISWSHFYFPNHIPSCLISAFTKSLVRNVSRVVLTASYNPERRTQVTGCMFNDRYLFLKG